MYEIVIKMMITPIVKHNPEKYKCKVGYCQFAGCNEHIAYNRALPLSNELCICHYYPIEKRRQQLMKIKDNPKQLSDFLAKFNSNDTKFTYIIDGITIRVNDEFDFCYKWYLYKGFDVQSCLFVAYTYDLPECNLFDLILTSLQRDIIMHIRSKKLKMIKR